MHTLTDEQKRNITIETEKALKTLIVDTIMKHDPDNTLTSTEALNLNIAVIEGLVCSLLGAVAALEISTGTQGSGIEFLETLVLEYPKVLDSVSEQLEGVLANMSKSVH